MASPPQPPTPDDPAQRLSDVMRGRPDKETVKPLEDLPLDEPSGGAPPYDLPAELIREMAGKSEDQISSLLSKFRTGLSEHRTRLSAHRTDMSEPRTDLSSYRSELSTLRTELSEQRTELSRQRTEMSKHRTELSDSRSLLSN